MFELKEIEILVTKLKIVVNFKEVNNTFPYYKTVIHEQ